MNGCVCGSPRCDVRHGGRCGAGRSVARTCPHVTSLNSLRAESDVTTTSLLGPAALFRTPARMKGLHLCHLIHVQHATAHVIRNLLPGKYIHNITLDDAFDSLDTNLIHRVIEARGMEKMQRYVEHVQHVAMQGDDYVHLLELLLENREELDNHPRREYASHDPRYCQGSPRTLELLWQHARLWLSASAFLPSFTVGEMNLTKDEFYARLLLKYRPTGATMQDLVVFCGKYGTPGLAEDVMRAVDGGNNRGRRVEGYMYKNAAKTNNLAVMQFLGQRYPLHELHKEGAFIGGVSLDRRWFSIEILTQPLTDERKQVLLQVLTDVPELRGSCRNILWLMGDPDLLQWEEETMDDHTMLDRMKTSDADGIVYFFLNNPTAKVEHANQDRLVQMINYSISYDMRARLCNPRNAQGRESFMKLHLLLRPRYDSGSGFNMYV